MFAASWFRLSKRALTAVVSKTAHRKTPRPPTHSRPSLEYLEERITPDGASGNLGIVDNGAVNFQGGITLVPNPPSSNLSGIAVGVFTSPLNASGGLDLSQLGLGLAPNIPNFNQFILGFGSGTQPDKPWVPNAYNLGLANQQAAFPTMADYGFQAPPPWRLHTAYHPPADAADDANEADTPPRISLVLHDHAKDDKLADKILGDEQTNAVSEEANALESDFETQPIPLVPHAATVTEDAEITDGNFVSSPETDTPETASLTLQTVWDDEATVWKILIAQHRNDAEVSGLDRGRDDAASPNEDNAFVLREGEEIAPAMHKLNLSDALVLSVLTPGQFMALMTAFPAEDGHEEAKALAEAK